MRIPIRSKNKTRTHGRSRTYVHLRFVKYVVLSSISRMRLMFSPMPRREGRFPERSPNETSVAEEDAFFSSAEHNAQETSPAATKGGSKRAAVVSPAPWMETIKSLVPAAYSGKVGRECALTGLFLLLLVIGWDAFATRTCWG